MSQQHLQYNPSQCLSTACGACQIYCPMDCIILEPFTITPDCIDCEQCVNNCPKGEKVLRIAYNDELGGGWISPFGYQPSTNPSEGESSQNPSQEPNKGDSSQGDSSQESSNADSKSDFAFTPADKAKLEALKNALLSAPPPLQNTSKHKGYKRDRFSKAIHIYDELKSLIAQ